MDLAPAAIIYAVSPSVILNQINLAVADMEVSVAFYRHLGIELDVTPDGRHAAAELSNGMVFELDTTDFVPTFDTGWRGATGGSAVIGFGVASPAAVDALYAELTASYHGAHQPPYDAFWGAATRSSTTQMATRSGS